MNDQDKPKLPQHDSPTKAEPASRSLIAAVSLLGASLNVTAATPTDAATVNVHPQIQAAKPSIHTSTTPQLKTNQLKTNSLRTNQHKTNQLKADYLKTNQLKSDNLKTNQLKTNQNKSGGTHGITVDLNMPPNYNVQKG
jgi:hypothetical protein